MVDHAEAFDCLSDEEERGDTESVEAMLLPAVSANQPGPRRRYLSHYALASVLCLLMAAVSVGCVLFRPGRQGSAAVGNAAHIDEFNEARALQVRADSDAIGDREKFEALRPDRALGPGKHGRVALRALNGGYITSDHHQHFTITCSDPGEAQVFKLIRNNGKVSLQDSEGHFMTVLLHGSVVQGDDSAGAWESLEQVYNDDGTFALRSYHGRYISIPHGSEACGGRAVHEKSRSDQKEDNEVKDAKPEVDAKKELAVAKEAEEIADQIASLTKALDEEDNDDSDSKPKSDKEAPFRHAKRERTILEANGTNQNKAPVDTFYMYRAQNMDNYAMENVNTANLAGVMWYIHNEVVATTPRKYGIQRIIRLKVQVATPQRLRRAGMTFGVRFAYDGEACTGAGPWVGPPACEEQWKRYGYFIGCNNLNSYPFPMPMQGYPCYYPNAVWYSMPREGRCNCTKVYGCKQSAEDDCSYCRPTGEDDCIYSYKLAGEVMVDDIAGIKDYWSLANSGDWSEYDLSVDHGKGCSFWDGKFDVQKCEQRLKKAQDVFRQHYPGDPTEDELPAPKCDFDCDAFYSSPPPECHFDPTDLKCDTPDSCKEVQQNYDGA